MWAVDEDNNNDGAVEKISHSPLVEMTNGNATSSALKPMELESFHDDPPHSNQPSQLQHILQRTFLFSIIFLTLYYSTITYICGAQYFWSWREDGSWLVALCQPLNRYGWTWQIQKHHAGFPMWPPSILLALILCVIPILLLLVPRQSTLPRFSMMRRRGDPNMKLWVILLLVIPTLITLGLMLGRPIPTKTQQKFEATGYAKDPFFQWTVALTIKWANVCGYCATVALSFFLVPVSKQSPLLQALGLSPALAVQFHIWAGRLCWILVTIHGALYSIEQPLFSESKKATLLQKALYELLPSQSRCWSLETPWKFLSPDEHRDYHCYRPWRNVTGIISYTALLLLVTTSWNWIRRRHYRIFYLSHIVLAAIMMLFAVFHFYWIAVYLLPGMLYYLACSLPILFKSRQGGGGVPIQQGTIIPNSNGCFELRLQAVTMELQTVSYPAYVKICVPEISRWIWHPFTLAQPISTSGDLRLLIRKSGRFTNQLHQRMVEEEPFTVLVDAIYQGADWASEISQHDTNLLIAGGIGITPILSVLLKLLQSGGATTDIHIHWYCPEKALIQYVLTNYLKPVLERVGGATLRANRSKVHFTIHYTSVDPDDKDGFAFVTQDDDGPSKRPCMTANDIGAKPFEGSTKNLRRLTAAGLGATTLLHLIWYNLATWNVRDRIFFRGYILYAALFIIAAGFLVVERVQNRWGHQLLPTKEEEDDYEDVSNADTELGDLDLTTPRVIQTKHYELCLEVSPGRPILNDVIQPVVECSAPAVFYCGPDSLWTNVSQRIHTERKFRHGRFAHCAFFKEHFEL